MSSSRVPSENDSSSSPSQSPSLPLPPNPSTPISIPNDHPPSSSSRRPRSPASHSSARPLSSSLPHPPPSSSHRADLQINPSRRVIAREISFDESKRNIPPNVSSISIVPVNIEISNENSNGQNSSERRRRANGNRRGAKKSKDSSPPPSDGPSDPSSSQSQSHPPSSSSLSPSSSSPFPLLSVRHEIWGTDINVSDVENAFDDFLSNFSPQNIYENGIPNSQSVGNQNQNPKNGNLSFYIEMLSESIATGAKYLNLNCENLFSYSPNLYTQLITYPTEVIPIFDRVVDRKREILSRENSQNSQNDIHDEEFEYIQVRPFNLRDKKSMRELNPEDIETLVTVKGMVIRVGPIQPTLKIAHFVCCHCGHHVDIPIIDNRISEPKQCEKCQQKFQLSMEHNRSTYSDRQYVKIQETPDNIPEGETPHSVNIITYGALVDVAKPGDRVEVTGIYKADPIRPNPLRHALNTVYSTSLDAIHFRKTDGKRLENETSDMGKEDDVVMSANESNLDLDVEGEAKNEREGDDIRSIRDEWDRRMRSFGLSENIYERLVLSLAPSIWEMDDVKKGILCMLFGGTNSEEGAASGRFRGEINILMCGDPGVAKSQLLQYVNKIAPRGIYTSGKGSSAVGLTASVVRDPDSKEMVLESGALVLSDRGICCIDEFDKMSDSTRSILHEVMEQQTVSIAKAGIVCTLNARTSILASANPKESRYNPNLSVVENIQIMPTLLSRFDLIYLVLDTPNEQRDRKLAKHLVKMYYDFSSNKINNQRIPPPSATSSLLPSSSSLTPLSMEDLTRYISYCRRHVKPQLTDGAKESLIDCYTKMRNMGHQSSNKVVTATPRQLEALIRLSESLARMRQSPLVEIADVIEAKRLMDVATASAATDPTTGRIDMDLITTGHSHSERDNLSSLIEKLKEIIAASTARNIRMQNLTQQFNSAVSQSSAGGKVTRVTDEQMREMCKTLHAENFIELTHDGYVKKRNTI